MEIWKQVINYEGRYEVSNKGRVQSLNYRNTGERGIRKTYNDGQGYQMLGLYSGTSHHRERVHRLVAQAFIPNPNNYCNINHKDEDKSNNDVNNLEWCDSKYNTNYGSSIERRSKKAMKPVIQYSLTGKKLNDFNSISDALKFVGGKRFGSISNACKGTQDTAYGYRWNYKEVS